MDVHGGVDGEVGVADGGAGGSGGMARGGGEIAAGTFDGVGVAVALSAAHVEIVGGNELVERSAVAVRSDVSAFGLGDLQQVAANTNETDGLRGGRAAISGRHLLQIDAIDDKEKSRCDHNAQNGAHSEIVALPEARCKQSARGVVLGNNAPILISNPPRSDKLLLTEHLPLRCSTPFRTNE